MGNQQFVAENERIAWLTSEESVRENEKAIDSQIFSFSGFLS
jgi:hypothetical protein